MTPPQFHVRRARPADIPALAGYAAELYRLHHRLDPDRFWDLGGEAPERVAGRERFFASQLEDADTRLLVAEQDERVVGFAYLTFETHDYADLLESAAWLHDVWVAPEARGGPIADALFAHARAEAVAAGHVRMVFTVAATNARAQAFFQRQGARVTMHEMTVDLREPTGGDTPG
jgi:ribosomal protein S18 acetylase RimI-like enzyme